jgi:hypothetical protein
MINTVDDVADLKIDESNSFSSSLKSHHHESSGYSSKEAECSSPENKTHHQHRHPDTKLKQTSNYHSQINRITDTHRRRNRPMIPTLSSTTVLTNDCLVIDESKVDPQRTVRISPTNRCRHSKSNLSEVKVNLASNELSTLTCSFEVIKWLIDCLSPCLSPFFLE